MICPFCSAENPPLTEKCECGYKFKGYIESENDNSSYNQSERKYPKGSPGDEYVEGVVLKGIDMDFMDIVSFMVKWSIAAIPATLILGFIKFIIIGIFIGLGGGFGWFLN